MKSFKLTQSAWVDRLAERSEILRILVRHAALFAFVFLCVLALTFVAYWFTPVRYIATGTVLVGESEPAIAQTPGDTLKVGDPADMESQLVIARSQTVMRRALSSPQAQTALSAECVAQNGEGFDGNCNQIGNRMDRLVEYASARYSIGAVGRSRIINIAYISSQPQVASDMANALVAAFLAEQRETVTQGRENAASWLREEASDLDAEIRALDRQIADYRSQNGLVRGASAPVNSERLTAIGQQLALAQAAQANASAKLQEISNAALGGSANATAVLESRAVGDLKQRITEAEARLASARTTLGPAHPRLRSLNDEVAGLNTRLNGEIGRITQNAEKQYEMATQRLALLNAQLDAAKSEVSAAADGEVDIEGLLRQVEIKRQQYADLAGRVNQLEVERRVSFGNVRLVSEAKVPLKPFFPKKVPFAAAGLTLGLLFGAVAAVLAGRFSSGQPVPARRTSPLPAGGTSNASPIPAPRQNSSTFRDRPLKFSAIIPYLRTSSGQNHDHPATLAVLEALIQDADGQNALDDIAWGLASGRSSVDGGCVLLVTSPSAGSGKSITAAALARHLTQAGEKVLVVECNLARPTVADLLQLPNASSESARLPQDPIVESAFPKLDVVPLGYARLIMPHDASSERGLADLLAWARKQYALVVLDGPTAGASNLQQLIDHADVVAVCAKRDELDLEATAPALTRLLADRPMEVGVVATMVNLGSERKLPQEEMAETSGGR